jgi:hypothetical protein
MPTARSARTSRASYCEDPTAWDVFRLLTIRTAML